MPRIPLPRQPTWPGLAAASSAAGPPVRPPARPFCDRPARPFCDRNRGPVLGPPQLGDGTPARPPRAAQGRLPVVPLTLPSMWEPEAQLRTPRWTFTSVEAGAAGQAALVLGGHGWVRRREGQCRAPFPCGFCSPRRRRGKGPALWCQSPSAWRQASASGRPRALPPSRGEAVVHHLPPVLFFPNYPEATAGPRGAESRRARTTCTF